MKKRGAPARKEQPAFDRAPLLGAVMRHELFGSLNSMTMVAGLLQERARKGALDAEELTRLAGRLVKQVERATHIVDHYLDFIGVSAEPEEARCSARDLVEILGRAGLDAGGIDESMNLAIDAGSLRFALERVLAFANEQRPPGHELEARVEPDEDDLVIEIQHGGGALTVDDLHVFEHGPRRVSPVLIDLAVARRILTDAGGEMAPRSGGFHVRIPVADE